MSPPLLRHWLEQGAEREEVLGQRPRALPEWSEQRVSPREFVQWTANQRQAHRTRLAGEHAKQEHLESPQNCDSPIR